MAPAVFVIGRPVWRAIRNVMPDPYHGPAWAGQRRPNVRLWLSGGPSPFIGHLKFGHRMERNDLKDCTGDAANALPAVFA